MVGPLIFFAPPAYASWWGVGLGREAMQGQAVREMGKPPRAPTQLYWPGGKGVGLCFLTLPLDIYSWWGAGVGREAVLASQTQLQERWEAPSVCYPPPPTYSGWVWRTRFMQWGLCFPTPTTCCCPW